jgi:FlaA1/EpsC-like NDP-sugar epimerase
MKTRIPSRASSWWHACKRELVRYRRPLIVIGQLALVVITCYLAFWLRFDGDIPPAELARFNRTLPWLLGFRAVGFAVFRLYEGLWRYTSIWDLSRIILGVVSSTVVFFLFVRFGLGSPNYPRSIFIIDAVLLILCMGGIRLTRRIRHEFVRPKADCRVLIYGAGDAGEMLVRDMLKRHRGTYQPIGFIDDDRRKVGARIHGVRVLGTRSELPAVIERLEPQEVIVAVPTLSPVVMREIVAALEPYKVRITTLPRLSDIVDGKVSVTQVRGLSIEDLLPRAPVGLDVNPMRHLVAGRTVLVTGAGGSIGSELCRQLVTLAPRALVMYERHENSLYIIASELEDAGYAGIIRPVIGDITDLQRLDRTFADFEPAIVFHAAAHKHVPMMELNVCEAVKNNVTGTRMVAEAAVRHRTERFILISTDKAVEPSSVMGATKRIAELTVQALPHQNTSLCAVRFGNVLGSNGSVIPRFEAQIRAGGPVTVTHPEMRRYFMLIPEAVQLVLQAAALPRHSRNVYVLDMGDQINLTDMARNLIRLSGFVPDEEIAIQYTGLRPGEKLSERLVADDEWVETTAQDKILRVSPLFGLEARPLLNQIRDLELHAVEGDADAVIREMCQIVPSFTPTGVPEVVACATPSLKRPAAAYLRHVALTRTPGPREYGDRRSGPLDRRVTIRGGRRLADRVRLASSGSGVPVAPGVPVEDLARRAAAGAARNTPVHETTT